MAQLSGKVALVTGGSRGIGAAIARALAAEGAAVAVTYGHSAAKADSLVREIIPAGGQALAIQADGRDAAAVEAAVEKTAATFGGLDILVNNAGIFEAGPIAEFPLEAFDRTMDINVRAVFVASRAAAQHLRNGGRIINIGSNLAQRVPFPGISVYSASKAALIALTKGWARDLGEREITVNVVHPGSTETDMNPSDGPTSDAQRSLMAIRRYSEPHDVANLVRWLAGPEARSVTGAEFVIDNGSNA